MSEATGSAAEGRQVPALTALQVEVARAFFALHAARGFLLAGGAALAAQGMTVRPTQDLDLFTSPGRGDVAAAAAALEQAAADHGWVVRRVRSMQDFARLVISGPEESVVVGWLPRSTPASTSSCSPTCSTPWPGSPTTRSPYPPEQAAAVREFAADWAAQLRGRQNRA
jgi:hypothetical protein